MILFSSGNFRPAYSSRQNNFYSQRSGLHYSFHCSNYNPTMRQSSFEFGYNSRRHQICRKFGVFNLFNLQVNFQIFYFFTSNFTYYLQNKFFDFLKPGSSSPNYNTRSGNG